MNFDKKRYLLLREEFKRFPKINDLGVNWDGVKRQEFSIYKCIIENKICWQSRIQYLQILKDFVNKIPDGLEFADQYSIIRS